MSWRERKRLTVIAQVEAKQLSLTEAAEHLRVSYRQAKRLLARWRVEGDAGLVHRLRGRASNRRGDAALRDRALARYAESFADYGPTLAAEVLAEEQIHVPVETLRRWLKAAGLWAPKRKRKAHRRRRARRARFGELVQLDGSIHDWFEGRRKAAVLMVMIDDATGRVGARFFEAETQAAAFEMYLRYARAHGLPRALYVDRASIYRSDREPTEAEILTDKWPQTEFGRAMESLGTELILANSPQAKGRVERMNGTLQDRLTKALRRAGIDNLEGGNRFLEEEFLAPFNARFEVPPAHRRDAHRAAPSDRDLILALAPHEKRVVQNDWTVRWHNAYLQLDRESHVEPGDKVTVIAPLEGPVRVLAGERELPWSAARSEPKRERKRPSRGVPTGSSQGQKPAADHPWRGRFDERPVGVGHSAHGGGAACVAVVAALPARSKPPHPR